MPKTRRSFWRNRRWPLRAAGIAALVASISTTGCNSSCDTSDQGNPPQIFTGGITTNDVYATSPLTSNLLFFPGGRQYLLVHHLGFTPAALDVEFNFSPDGQALAPCSGNSCVVRCKNSEIIWLQNDTCTDFFVRVTASLRDPDQSGIACPGGGFVSANGMQTLADGGPTVQIGVGDGAPDGEASALGTVEADALIAADAPTE